MPHADPYEEPIKAWGYPLPEQPPPAAPITVPEDIKEIDRRILELRQAKEAAVDSEDFQAAGEIRTAEKRLLAHRAAKVKLWAASIDIVAAVHEAEALRRQVQHLRRLLTDRGVEVTDDLPGANAGNEASH